MIELNCVTLDDKEYAIIETLNYNDNYYVYLVNTSNEEDLLINKVVPSDDGNYFYPFFPVYILFSAGIFCQYGWKTSGRKEKPDVGSLDRRIKKANGNYQWK